MNILPRRDRPVTPLSPGVESLLRSVPRIEPLADAHALRIQLMAAHARGTDESYRPSLGSALWVRFAIPASAAASIVLGIGYLGHGSPAGRSIVMADSGFAPLAAVLPSPSVRVVDDASIPMSTSRLGLASAYVGPTSDLLDGP